VDIDIGGQLKKALDEAIDRARKLETSQDLEKAGLLWEKASALMLKYAECSTARGLRSSSPGRSPNPLPGKAGLALRPLRGASRGSRKSAARATPPK
jgi:hypothetical protein